MSGQIRPDDAKMKELILYVAERSADDPYFGATKLNKILFFSDFLAYAFFGKPITGQPYFKLPHGPAPRRLLPIQEEMERDEDIVIAQVQRYAFRQKKVIPLRPAKLDAFTPNQLDLVQEVVEAFRSKSAFESSEVSHSFLGWELVEEREDIPYSTIFLTREKPDAEHLERYRDLAFERGWVSRPAIPA